MRDSAACDFVLARVARVSLLALNGLALAGSSAAGQVSPKIVAEISRLADAGSAAAECAEVARSDRSDRVKARAVFAGRVLFPHRASARSARVTTSAGGQASTAADGSFALEVDVPIEADSVQLTAVAGAGVGSLVASARVDSLASGRITRVGDLALAATTSCQPTWLPTFGEHPGMDASIDDLEVFDDGSGPALYACGSFFAAGGNIALHIAKWNGTGWAKLGGFVNSGIEALTVFDDGSGPALYVGGWFTTAGGVAVNRIAKWNGTSWSALGAE
jgi:hypothetical protein